MSRALVRRSVLSACVLAAIVFAPWRTRAAGTISGVVFEDFNGNGLRDTTTTIANSSGVGMTPTAIDRGIAGIQVLVFDSAGTQQGRRRRATPPAAYSAAAGGAGPYRVEFTGLPAGYQPSRRRRRRHGQRHHGAVRARWQQRFCKPRHPRRGQLLPEQSVARHELLRLRRPDHRRLQRRSRRGRLPLRGGVEQHHGCVELRRPVDACRRERRPTRWARSSGWAIAGRPTPSTPGPS